MSRLEKAHLSFLEKHVSNIENGTITLHIHDGIVSRIEKQTHALLDEQMKLSKKEEINI